MATQIALRIHNVKCLDEMGGQYREKFGNDEIHLSGFGIDANGATIKVPVFEVYAHFDDGEVKNYSPPHKFVALSLGNTPANSSTVTVGFLLSEKQQGGMSTALDKIYTKVKEEIQKQKEKEQQKTGFVAAAIPWGVLWAVAKPVIVNFIANKIIGELKDKLFDLRDVTLTIPTANHTWNGSKISPQSTVQFVGHDGKYLLTYDWELI